MPSAVRTNTSALLLPSWFSDFTASVLEIQNKMLVLTLGKVDINNEIPNKNKLQYC